MKIHCEYCRTKYVYRTGWPNCPNCGAPANQTMRRINAMNNVKVNIGALGVTVDEFSEAVFRMMRVAF